MKIVYFNMDMINHDLNFVSSMLDKTPQKTLHIVPTLCVGMPSGRSASSDRAIVMRRRASGDGVAHAERGNDNLVDDGS